MSSSYRGRFAPSPTGHLHLGNARTALAAWLRARACGGAFVLRVEDIDEQRSRPEAVEGNLGELRWLGIDWDEGPDVGGPHGPYLQSERTDLYAAAFERLAAAGALFACYLSRKDLAEVASAPHGEATGRVYGPADRARSAALAPARAAAGAQPSWRFAVPPDRFDFVDGCVGPTSVDVAGAMGDFVVRRADGQWAYQLAVVVDDAAMGITEVVRGADLLASTGAQLALYAALGERPPRFRHVGLLLDEGGERMAKRRGSLTLHELRAAGVRPQRVLGLLAHLLGCTPSPAELSADELRAAFDPQLHGCQDATLGPAALAWLLGG